MGLCRPIEIALFGRFAPVGAICADTARRRSNEGAID